MTFDIKKAIEKIFIAILVLLFVVIVYNRTQNVEYNESNKVKSITDGWYYYDGNEKIYVTLPANIKLKNSDKLVLYHEDMTEEYMSYTILTKGAEYDLTISVDGDVIYRFDDSGFHRNKQMAAKMDCRVDFPRGIEGNRLELTYANKGGKEYSISPVYIGTSDAIFRYQIKNVAFSMGIVFVMLVLGVAAIAGYTYLKYRNMTDKRFANVAVFLLICSIWIITDASVVQYIFHYSTIVTFVSFYAFSTFAIPMIHFVQNTGDMKKYRIFDALVYLFYVNLIVQSIMECAGIFEFTDMLFVTHILLVVSIATIIYTMFREYKQTYNKKIYKVLLTFSIMAVSGILSIIIYWGFNFDGYELIFECGILIFITILFGEVLASMALNIRYQAELKVYQDMANKDKLTGLNNRRAYEKIITEIEDSEEIDGNVALIFMDLNYLKKANDVYGHEAGDNLIKCAANCIEAAFGKIGKSYRIGGDEFCTVILNTFKSERELMNLLDKEISRTNKTKRDKNISLSIARGISYLLDEAGNRKTISNWKHEADKRMYNDKEKYHKY